MSFAINIASPEPRNPDQISRYPNLSLLERMIKRAKFEISVILPSHISHKSYTQFFPTSTYSSLSKIGQKIS